jgi:hypothetical protein
MGQSKYRTIRCALVLALTQIKNRRGRIFGGFALVEEPVPEG